MATANAIQAQFGSQLNRNKKAAKREKVNPGANRESLSYSPVRNSEIYPAQTEEQRAAMDAYRKSELQKKKQYDKQQIKAYLSSGQLNAQLARQGFKDQQRTLQDQTQEIQNYQQDVRRAPVASPQRAKGIQGLRKAKQIQKTAKIAKKGVSVAKTWISRVWGRGGVSLDWPGETLWTWLTTGAGITFIQFVRTFILKGDIKGIVGTFIPEKYDLKSPFTWGIDLPITAIMFFIVALVLAVVFLSLIVTIMILAIPALAALAIPGLEFLQI